MIKGIIYDLDDLMVNSHPLHYQSVEVALKEYGHSASEIPKQIESKFVGKRVRDVLKEIIKYFKLDVGVDVLHQKKEDYFLKLVQKELQIMPGLMESLELFKKNSFKIALASSGTNRYINLALDKFKIRKLFDVIVSGDDVKMGKPDPETYLVTAKKLGLKPKECLVLEDAANGITSAKAAGCKCIAIDSPNTPTQDLSKADLVLDSLDKVGLKIINSMCSVII